VVLALGSAGKELSPSPSTFFQHHPHQPQKNHHHRHQHLFNISHKRIITITILVFPSPTSPSPPPSPPPPPPPPPPRNRYFIEPHIKGIKPMSPLEWSNQKRRNDNKRRCWKQTNQPSAYGNKFKFEHGSALSDFDPLELVSWWT